MSKKENEIDEGMDMDGNGMFKIAFQGENGAFSQIAVLQAFPESFGIDTIGFNTFQQVFDAVESGAAEYGVIPAENSISGTLHVIYDHLVRSTLIVVGECACVQEHCLIGLEGTNVADIKRVMSQPVILEQCEAYISSLERQHSASIERLSAWDSSGACHVIKAQKLANACAIASEHAANVHGLKVRNFIKSNRWLYGS